MNAATATDATASARLDAAVQSATMTAIAYERFGAPDVLQPTEIAMPAVKDNEILIRIRAAAITPSDAAFRSGNPFAARLAAGPIRPRVKVLGDSLAGDVVAVGSGVTRFVVGDRVFGSTGPGMGAYAEYKAVPDDAAIIPMPDSMSYEDGAALADGGLTALPFLRDTGKIAPGKTILINGASGAIGTIAVQLAKHFGADVTAVTSGRNAEMVKSLGADRVIDYTKGDFTRSGETYDIIFDAVGKSSFSQAKRALKPGGIYMTTVISMGILGQVARTSIAGSRKAKFSTTGLRKPDAKAKDLALFAELYQAGTLRPVVERSYALTDMAAAHAHVDSGRKVGSIVAAMG